MDYTKIFNEYNYTENIDNRFPETDKQMSIPLIILDGWYNSKKFEKSFKHALIKQNSFFYVLKFNILKKLQEKKLIEDIPEEIITPYITFHVNEFTYPNLCYCKYNGLVISNYKIDYSPGYIAFILNDLINFPILNRTTSNYIREIRHICYEEYIKLQKILKN